MQLLDLHQDPHWGALLRPEAFRLLAGEDASRDYQFASRSGSTCSAAVRRAPVRARALEEIGGDYVSIKLGSLDDATPAEVVAAPVKYANGRDNKWWSEPEETRHL